MKIPGSMTQVLRDVLEFVPSKLLDDLVALHLPETTYLDNLNAILDELGSSHPLVQAYIHDYSVQNPEKIVATYEAAGAAGTLGDIYLRKGFHEKALRSFIKSKSYARAAYLAWDRGDTSQATKHFVMLEQLSERRLEFQKPQLSRQLDVNAQLYAIFSHVALVTLRIESEESTTEDVARVIRSIELCGYELTRQGQNDAAKLCYLALAELGELLGRYELFAEGFTNAIRASDAQKRRYETLRWYACFSDGCARQNEEYARAQVLDENARYAEKNAFNFYPYFFHLAAEAWKKSGHDQASDPARAHLVEQCMTAAARTYLNVGAWQPAYQCYEFLLSVDALSHKFDSYQELAAELEDRIDDLELLKRQRALPAFFSSTTTHVPRVRDWLIAHESKHDVEDTCLQMLGDYQNVFRANRRFALIVLCALECSRVRDSKNKDRTQPNTQSDAPKKTEKDREPSTANAISLEMPFEWRIALTKVEHSHLTDAVLRNTKRITSKEAFQILEGVMKSPNINVVEETGRSVVRALSNLLHDDALREDTLKLCLTHSRTDMLNPLIELYENESAVDIRHTLLRASARIGTARAAEFLIDVIHSGSSDEVQKAKEALLEGLGERMLQPIRQEVRFGVNPALREYFASLLQRIEADRS